MEAVNSPRLQRCKRGWCVGLRDVGDGGPILFYRKHFEVRKFLFRNRLIDNSHPPVFEADEIYLIGLHRNGYGFRIRCQQSEQPDNGNGRERRCSEERAQLGGERYGTWLGLVVEVSAIADRGYVLPIGLQIPGVCFSGDPIMR